MYDIKTYWGMVVWLLSLLNSSLDNTLLASRFKRFVSWKKNCRYPQHMKLSKSKQETYEREGDCNALNRLTERKTVQNMTIFCHKVDTSYFLLYFCTQTCATCVLHNNITANLLLSRNKPLLLIRVEMVKTRLECVAIAVH